MPIENASPTVTRRGSSSKHIAVVASLTLSLTNFRFQLLKAFIAAGHTVTAFAPEDDPDVIARLQQIGVRFIRIPMSRTGLNPLADLNTLVSLYRHFKRIKPDLVLPYTMKPIIYGSLAARMAGIRLRYALFTGMGHVFADPNPKGRTRLVRYISVRLYRLALKGAKGIFLYNSADDDDVNSHRLVGGMTFVKRVSGSGVDLREFPHVRPRQHPVVFLLVARLLRDKGIFEYAEAAKDLHRHHPHAKFQLLGPFEPHASSVSQEDIDRFATEGSIDYLGETRDVRPYLAACSVFVLPSTYREGIPRSILEAMATGRAIITTDAPGCADTVENGKNGYLVPPRDSKSLAKAMERFIVEPTLIETMGEASRKLAESKFNVHAINRMLLSNMGLLNQQDHDER